MALIDASMLDEIFPASMPFSRDANERFLLDVDGLTLLVTGGILEVGLVDTTNIAPGAIGPTEISITSVDVPHSSPNIAATDVHDSLEEVALGYISRLPLAGGVMSGIIDMAGNKVTDLPLASAEADAMSLASGRILVREGYFYRAPVGYAGVGTAQGALQPGWIRATASIYVESIPAPGDTLVINGVTLTFQPIAGPNIIEIGVDEATTALNAVSEINANTTLTLDGTALNTNVFALADSGDGTAFHLVVLNEDPPNTAEDGNLKPLTALSSALRIRSFEGGLGSVTLVEDGMLVPDLLTNRLFIYDLMDPLDPWKDVAGGGGAVDASNVWYTGPPIPNVDPTTPDHLQNILISLNTVLGSGLPPALHAGSHESSGLDEIDVTGLLGLLGDPQTPTAHKISHQFGGGDALNVVGLSGKLADLQDAGWLQGSPVSAAVPGVSQVLTWSGAAWAPASSGAGSDFDTITSVTGPGLIVNDVVYISASNTATKADATSAATGPAIGIVVAAAAGIVDIRMFGVVTTLAGLTPGAEYYVSTTAGGLTTTPSAVVGHYVQRVGIALTSTTLVVSTSLVSVNA